MDECLGARRRTRALLGVDVAAEIHQRLDRFGDEGRRLRGVGEGVRAGADRFVRAGGEDLRFHRARRAVVEVVLRPFLVVDVREALLGEYSGLRRHKRRLSPQGLSRKSTPSAPPANEIPRRAAVIPSSKCGTSLLGARGDDRSRFP